MHCEAKRNLKPRYDSHQLQDLTPARTFGPKLYRYRGCASTDRDPHFTYLPAMLPVYQKPPLSTNIVLFLAYANQGNYFRSAKLCGRAGV